MTLETVTPAHKKGNRSEKENYPPISILPNLSKVFNRYISNQIAYLFDKIILEHQCDFRQGRVPQHWLIFFYEKVEEECRASASL